MSFANMKNPKYSIIVVHYQGTVSHDIFMRGMESIKNIDSDDYEVLVYHDGPLIDLDVIKESPYPVKPTDVRYNDFGHSLRDIGIREAKGEYIIHTNADNVFYPNLIKGLNSALDIAQLCKISIQRDIEYDPDIPSDQKIVEIRKYEALFSDNIIVYPIYLMGVHCMGAAVMTLRDFKPGDPVVKSLMTGYPAVPYCIDAMQLVMRRDVWLSYGGWYDKDRDSDGTMYRRFVREHRATYATEPLGEHWP
mgnify:CR=1 FL=1